MYFAVKREQSQSIIIFKIFSATFTANFDCNKFWSAYAAEQEAK